MQLINNVHPVLNTLKSIARSSTQLQFRTCATAPKVRLTENDFEKPGIRKDVEASIKWFKSAKDANKQRKRRRTLNNKEVSNTFKS